MFIMIHFSSMPYLAKLAAKILFFSLQNCDLLKQI